MAKTRITSLDTVRGIVMILMAIDHVRVYSGVPAGGPTAGIFFTRWITHFVAPGFVFFAGTAAYLHGGRKFLVTRGVWLIVLELTAIRLCWTFNVDFAHYLLAGVIWVIGWSMIILAAASYLPSRVIGALGIAIIALHNLIPPLDGLIPPVDGLIPQVAEPNALLKILYFGGPVGPLFILYVIVPWAGVMMAGYAFGPVMELPAERRRAIAMRIGAFVTILFVILRWLDVYGDPRPWHGKPVLFFINTTKYPASLLFLLMTLGPILLLLAWAESLAESWPGKVLTTFGRVPMFYYLLHIPLIHAAACVVSLIREGRIDPWLFGNHPVEPPPVPPGYQWPLWLLYLVWVICVAILYVPCRWYARVRAASQSKWLSYL
jgi:uncharacterized membrane protein